MDRPRRIALLLVVLAGAWLGLTCAAMLHHCPDDASGSHDRTCEFYGHSVQSLALAGPRALPCCALWEAVPGVPLACASEALPPNPFDRACTCERAPPA